LGDRKLSKADTIKKALLNKAFDPNVLESRATDKQDKVLRDVWSRHKYVIAGNQCLAKGTLVLTTTGIKAIEDIIVGDYVFDEHGNPIKVLKTFNNGIKPVYTLSHRKMTMAKTTGNHVFLTKNSSARKYKEEELKVSEFKRDTQIKRVELTSMLGKVVEKHAYAIGVFLGDGCFRQFGKVISSADPEIVEHVQAVIGGDLVKSPHNYNWRLKGSPNCNYYNEWCKGRYAHQKTVDLDVIKSWDRTSLLNFVAGVIDTDGSVYVDKWNNLSIAAEMQACPVIEALQYAFLALWQVETSIIPNNRDKFVNGPTFTIKTATNAYTKRILKELTNYLKCPRKQWKPEYDNLTSARSDPNWTDIKVSKEIEILPTYDIHVDSDTNLYCLANGLVTHNSGKSSLKARDIAWKFLESHPYWERPNNKRCMNRLCGSTEFETITNPDAPKAPPVYKCTKCPTQWMDWRREKLSFLVGSKTSQLTEELWDKKIEPYLRGYKYKVERQSTAIKKVINIDENSAGYGNEILFFSHDNSKQAKGRVQSLTLHDVWLDELPDSIDLIEELHRRVDAKRAQFCATFTPKTPNPEIRRLIDEGNPNIVGVYRFGMLDNPAYANRKQEQLEALKGFTKKKQDNILYGTWLDGDEKVFTFSTDKNTIPTLPDYDPKWPHVLAVDPAMTTTGYALACWKPSQQQWFVIKTGYIKADKENDDPTTIVSKAERVVAGLNVVRRIYDPHERWWQATAKNHAGVTYIPIPRKTERKKDLVQNLITAIAQRLFIFVGEQQECYDELHRADWHPDKDFIIRGSQNLHIIDSLQYLWDLLPKNFEAESEPLTRDQYIVNMWQKEKQLKSELSKAKPHQKHRVRKRLGAFRRRVRGI
jgi:hypothetical protein